MRFSVSVRVPRPVEEVFDHIVEPGLLASYFVSEASGPLVVGADVKWSWPEGQTEVVHVDAVETNRLVTFHRAGTRVTIALESGTKVTITEEGGELESAFEHCAGWQHMLMCLKARMEFGIDLRG